jgi:hypothetical protein
MVYLARREIFDLNLGKKARSLGGLSGFFSFIFYIVKHIFIYPVILLFWVGVLSVILAFLARNTSLETIILISFSLVAVVRVMAHYDEDLSKDLAKMMPFALLGVFLVDVSYFSTSNTLSSLKEITTLWKSGVYYFIVLLLLEWVLKILYGFSRLFVKKKTASDDSEDE